MQFVCPLLLLSGPVGLWWGWIPVEHHCVLLYLSFFPLVSFSVRLLGNTSAWEGPIHLPFSLMGLFLLHVSQLSEERVWTAAQLLPKLNGFFMSAAPHKLPRTTAPRCGYSRGLHAPNSGCNSSLKMFLFYFFFSCLESRLSGYWWVRNKCKAFLLYWRTSDFFFLVCLFPGKVFSMPGWWNGLNPYWSPFPKWLSQDSEDRSKHRDLQMILNQDKLQTPAKTEE